MRTQTNGGTDVRHHQVGDELPPVPAAGAGASEPRMDAGAFIFAWLFFPFQSPG